MVRERTTLEYLLLLEALWYVYEGLSDEARELYQEAQSYCCEDSISPAALAEIHALCYRYLIA